MLDKIIRLILNLKKKNDYLYHHKRFWLYVASISGRFCDQRVNILSYCRKNGIKEPIYSSFACDDAIREARKDDNWHHYCKYCRINWDTFDNNCSNPDSNYILWMKEKNLEKRNELAIKIANSVKQGEN